MAEFITNPLLSRILISVLFMAMGTLHFINPEPFIRIMPQWIPNHRTMVLLSGAAECIGGFAFLFSAPRPLAAIGLIMLLFAVFPANIEMARNAWLNHGITFYTVLLLLRLPLQFVLMYWIYWAGIATG